MTAFWLSTSSAVANRFFALNSSVRGKSDLKSGCGDVDIFRFQSSTKTEKFRDNRFFARNSFPNKGFIIVFQGKKGVEMLLSSRRTFFFSICCLRKTKVYYIFGVYKRDRLWHNENEKGTRSSRRRNRRAKSQRNTTKTQIKQIKQKKGEQK